MYSDKHGLYNTMTLMLQARLMATIGVTRGFGDHGLSVYDTDIRIKPFLTPLPEVSECI